MARKSSKDTWVHCGVPAERATAQTPAGIAPGGDGAWVGHRGECQYLEGRERPGTPQAGERWDGGVGAQVEGSLLACQRAGAAVSQAPLERHRPDKAPRAHEQVGATRP